jgi:hypothetical protein
LTYVSIGTNQPKEIGGADGFQVPVLDKSDRPNWIAGNKQKLALLRDDPRISRREHTDGECRQFVNSCGDGFHVAMKAAGYGSG